METRRPLVRYLWCCSAGVPKHLMGMKSAPSVRPRSMASRKVQMGLPLVGSSRGSVASQPTSETLFMVGAFLVGAPWSGCSWWHNHREASGDAARRAVRPSLSGPSEAERQ